MKKLIMAVITTGILTLSPDVRADLPVIDPSVLAQSFQQVRLALEQVKQTAVELHRLGDW